MLSRRHLLRFGAAGAIAPMVLPIRRALALDAAPANLKFIYVVNYGGWDPTRVFATEFDNPNVDMERSADLATIGNIQFADHGDRPSVRRFFENNYQRSLLVNGVLVPSIAHENCLKWQMTGTTAEGSSDWPAILAAARAGEFAIPHMVVGGPSFPGELGGVVTRTGSSGQLSGLLDGSILDLSDVPASGPTARAEDVMDRYLQRRAAAARASAATARDQLLLGDYDGALGQALSLKNLQGVIDFGSAASFGAQIRLGVDALAQGVSRCVTVAFSYYSWDTHVANDLYQSLNFEMLFSGLNDLMERLAALPGDGGGTLADETMVVVLSEMGRTPQLNAGDGKDHWPYTSVLFAGPGITANRVVGGFDQLYYGEPVDPTTGEVTDTGVQLSSSALGATLLELCGIDSADYLTGTTPMPGVLSP